ncbi:MAG: hypothetical protein KKF48_02595 [Nanoarchaeota archaeon]|nr:hypothetical protein [Nanoarchaeota archaeon]MBU1027910.1 hypothetical protein [Nanoarchaeota archaeon]
MKIKNKPTITAVRIHTVQIFPQSDFLEKNPTESKIFEIRNATKIKIREGKNISDFAFIKVSVIV